jgi:demethylmenaquinone methyltransferase/2-methoxy-6-polyprenyl-1,4-benzoquinol methylase
MAYSRLVPGGIVAIADETMPERVLSRIAHRLKRAPLVAATYLLTQTTTRPVKSLPDRVKGAGFSRVTEERIWSGSFAIVHGVKGNQ